MVFRSVPLHVLQRDLASEVRESQLWLDAVRRTDPDRMCAQLAAAALATLGHKAEDGNS
jgi:hypothetical protein